MVGVDSVVVVKSWQPLESYGEFVGGSYPSHFFYVTKISDDESVNLIEECIKVNHGENAA